MISILFLNNNAKLCECFALFFIYKYLHHPQPPHTSFSKVWLLALVSSIF